MRKKILDEHKRQLICSIFMLGGTYRMAAGHVGCSRQTIYYTAKRDPGFREQIQKAKVNPEVSFLGTIRQAGAENKNWAAAKWALQHLYPDRYARKPRTMAVNDVKEFVSDLLAIILKSIPDSKTRVAVRRRVRKLTANAIRKSQNHRERFHGK